MVEPMFEVMGSCAYAEEEALGAPLDELSARVGEAQLGLLHQIATLPEDREWEDWGARNLTHWLSMRPREPRWPGHWNGWPRRSR
jgi:hypothetical protein